MGYEIFKFGALYLGDKIQRIPQQPTSKGDIPHYDGYSVISIGPEAQGGEGINWVRPNGSNLLIADRVLLNLVSLDNLKKSGLVEGKEVTIKGQRFLCRMIGIKTRVPEQDVYAENKDTPNEWNDILDITGAENTLWHWNHMYFWESYKVGENCITTRVRGNSSARNWDVFGLSVQSDKVGFRPVLELLGNSDPVSNCVLDGADFQLSSIPGSHGYCPILCPIPQNLFASIPDGQQVKMYTIMEGKYPVSMDFGFSDVSKLTLTDRYFGDENLVTWTISNGIAVASQSW